MTNTEEGLTERYERDQIVSYEDYLKIHHRRDQPKYLIVPKKLVGSDIFNNVDLSEVSANKRETIPKLSGDFFENVSFFNIDIGNFSWVEHLGSLYNSSINNLYEITEMGRLRGTSSIRILYGGLVAAVCDDSKIYKVVNRSTRIDKVCGRGSIGHLRGIVNTMCDDSRIKKVDRLGIVKKITDEGKIERLRGGCVYTVYNNGTIETVDESGTVNEIYDNGEIFELRRGFVHNMYDNSRIKKVSCAGMIYDMYDRSSIGELFEGDIHHMHNHSRVEKVNIFGGVHKMHDRSSVGQLKGSVYAVCGDSTIEEVKKYSVKELRRNIFSAVCSGDKSKVIDLLSGEVGMVCGSGSITHLNGIAYLACDNSRIKKVVGGEVGKLCDSAIIENLQRGIAHKVYPHAKVEELGKSGRIISFWV